MYFALQFIFSVNEDPFSLKITFLYDFKICFYDRNTFLMICAKCKIIPVSKISIWPCRKDKKLKKKRTRASLFQSSEDGKQEFFLMWPKKNELSMKNGVQIAKKIHNNVRY